MSVALAALAFTLQAPIIIPRHQWGALPPVLAMTRHQVKYITVHHAGVPTKKETPFFTKLQNLQKWCQREDKTSFAQVKPPWPDIPYHYYISWQGEIAECRNAGFVGDTNTTYDPTGHLLVVLEGSLDKEQPTEAQLQSLRQMTVWAAKKYDVSRVRIGAHRDYAKTTCPGENVMSFVRSLRTSF